MFHHAARAVHGNLFDTAQEAAVLWTTVVRIAPGLRAACLMPNHIHLLHPTDMRRALGAGISGYSRWRAAHRGRPGPALERIPDPKPVSEACKIARDIRYIHLNPCRARIVGDPLAWPWSTHRDAVGLCLDPVRRPVPDPVAFHRYVSSDPHVRVDGTPLPVGTGRFDLHDIWAATASIMRTPSVAMYRRGPARTLFVRAAKTLCECSTEEIATAARMAACSVRRIPSGWTDGVRLLAKVCDDPRFQGLPDDGVAAYRGQSRSSRGR